MSIAFTTPVEKQALVDAVNLIALNNAKKNVFDTIQKATECNLDLKFENSEISFIIEDELSEAGWLCVFRNNVENGKVETIFVPGEPRQRAEIGDFNKCTNCGKGIGRHFDDDDRSVNRYYCFKRGEEKKAPIES